jgi:hypothetical protein
VAPNGRGALERGLDVVVHRVVGKSFHVFSTSGARGVDFREQFPL